MTHTILFTGHMIDAKDRADVRFPANKENKVKQEIKNQLDNIKKTAQGKLRGIASGACGGDILFHELCLEMNIPTEMYLALSVEEFRKKSVSFAGPDWDKRFDVLINKLAVYILPDKNSNDDTNVWERTNLWMLDNAFLNAGTNMTLLALWNGKGGDGKGGTEHMVKITKQKGGKVDIIDINKIPVTK